MRFPLLYSGPQPDPPVPTTRVVRAALAVLVATASAHAQIVERRPRSTEPVEQDAIPTTYVGGSLTYAEPQGVFGDYVNAAFGLTGYLVHAFDPDGIVALRADLGYLIYGHTTRRQPLGGGALGLINVDVTTSNNIMFGGLGLQVMAPTGRVRPYVSGSLGFSYFFTTSSVEGSQNTEPFAQSDNYTDGGFTTMWGGGLYVPLRTGARPIVLDLGAQMHKNNDIQYLNKDSIHIPDSQSTPVITPIRSAADFITFRLGLTFGVR